MIDWANKPSHATVPLIVGIVYYITLTTILCADWTGGFRARDQLQGEGRRDEQDQAHHQLCLLAR
jgi:hypothetical protein